MADEFAHLHVHTQHSLLDGYSQVTRLAQAVQQAGMNAVAITDHGTLSGVPSFYRACTTQGIKPIIGVEAYLVDDMEERGSQARDYHHLLLLAETQTGYQNLLRLVSESYLRGFYYKPRLDKKTLQQYAEGLILTSGCLAGEIPQTLLTGNQAQAKLLIRQYQEMFGRENFFLEVQDHLTGDGSEQYRVNQSLYQLARACDAPLLATNDLHYVTAQDAPVQDVMLCVQTHAQLTDTQRMKFDGPHYYAKRPAEIVPLFSGAEDAVKNTLWVAERCTVALPFGQTDLLPVFPLPSDFCGTETEYLRHLALDGLHERYGELTEEIQKRFQYELGIISDKGFVSYFLVVWDFVNYARRQGMRCVARGSVAGSIIAYALGISNVDPLRYGLMFERFLNPERTAMPDIDMDFPDDRRAEVIEYVAAKYGRECVGQILTFNTVAGKGAVRDVARVLNQSPLGDAIARALPEGAVLQEEVGTNPEVRALLADPARRDDARTILQYALALEGSIRSTGVHPAGVIISSKPLVETAPLQRVKNEQHEARLVAGYEQKDLEELGLLKMDFLGLSNLTILQDCLQLIRKTTGDVVDLDHLPTDDAATFALLSAGETTGVFQLESPGMRAYIKALRPTEVRDLMALVALYRPGPIDAIPQFIRAKHGETMPTYLHPRLEPILRETFGIIVYQDQVLLAVLDLAGFSWAEVDKFRKAIGKKQANELMAQKSKFIAGCIQNGLDKTPAEEIFSFIEPFARYGFGRAHAAAYGMVAYQTAYLKTHYPDQFMAATLSKESGDAKKVARLLDECRRLGVQVRVPDINLSAGGFTLEARDDAPGRWAVRYGLMAIKGVGEKPCTALAAERAAGGPFISLLQVMGRCAGRAVTSGTVSALIRAGALDSLGERAALLASIEQTKKQAAKYRQKGLFDEVDVTLAPLSSIVPATLEERLAWEKKLLGVYLSGHPLDRYREVLATMATHDTALLTDEQREDEVVNQAVTVVGLLTEVEIKTTRADQQFAHGSIEDTQGALDFVCFSKAYRTSAPLWRSGTVVVLSGVMKRQNVRGGVQLHVESIEAIEAALHARQTSAEREAQEVLRILLPKRDMKTSVASVRLVQTALQQVAPTTPGEQGEQDNASVTVCEIWTYDEATQAMMRFARSEIRSSAACPDAALLRGTLSQQFVEHDMPGRVLVAYQQERDDPASLLA